MQKLTSTSALCFVLIATVAAAQTTVTTTGGTTNSVPLFTGTSTIGNSVITQSSGNVGVGTTAPSTLLQVYEGTYSQNAQAGWQSVFDIDRAGTTIGGITSDGNGEIGLFTGSSDAWANVKLAINSGGYVGVGTTSPSAPLHAVGLALGTVSGNTVPLLSLQNSNANGNFLNISQIRNSSGNTWTSATTRIQQVTDVSLQGYIDFNPPGGPWDVAFGSSSGEIMRLLNGGNVGVGTTSPGAKLEVNGGLKLTSGSGGSITFADGTVQTTAATGVGGTCGGDYAESVDVSGDRASYEPGDVLVITADAASDVAKSTEPYSTLVTGIYSTKPGVVGRRQTIDPRTSKTEIPMAMVGIVPTKVSTENGPIKRGDLLVTSSTAGYAMKGADRSQMLGAVIGKALGNLDAGRGVIEVVVTLQ